MLVVGLDSDGFVLILFVFVAEVVVDILGEELLSVVVVGRHCGNCAEDH